MPVETQSAEAHLLHFRSSIRSLKPQCAVVDPISALLRAGGEVEALSVVQRVVSLAKTAGNTLVLTSLLDTLELQPAGVHLPISRLADVWVHLAYVHSSGERNRTLNILFRPRRGRVSWSEMNPRSVSAWRLCNEIVLA